MVAIHLLMLAENNLVGCNLAEAAHGCGILGLVAEKRAAVRVHEAGALAKDVVVLARRPDNLTGADITILW